MQVEPAERSLVILSQPERAPMRPRKSRRDGGKGLVLERRLGESIDVGGPCRVTLLRTSGGKARLAIQADASVPIVRSELLERQAAERDRAATDTAA